jgi:glycosyltransferase involved in cell wall biosynthesis
MKSTPQLSVVLATYNRYELLVRLLDDLAAQTLPAGDFEVIVVDDGSAEAIGQRLEARKFPFSLTLLEQKNAGPAAARHRGACAARGDVLVLVDDDMRLPPQFLAEHLRYHSSKEAVAVVGRYVSDPGIRKKPLFERYLGKKWDQLSMGVARGTVRVNGTHLATGNASMTLTDYLAAGGLDASLPRAEDVALGLALEAKGVRIVFSESAHSIHMSDHNDPASFRRRVYMHGRLEPRIARRHPSNADADPWRFAFSLPALGRLVCVSSLLAPAFAERLAGIVYRASLVADRLGMEAAAMRGVGLVFGLDYFRGLRDEAGSLSGAVRACVAYTSKTHAGAPS